MDLEVIAFLSNAHLGGVAELTITLTIFYSVLSFYSFAVLLSYQYFSSLCHPVTFCTVNWMQNVHCDCPLASNELMIVYASLFYFAWHVWASKGSQSQLALGSQSRFKQMNMSGNHKHADMLSHCCMCNVSLKVSQMPHNVISHLTHSLGISPIGGLTVRCETRT